jgi:hypothetical protein
MERIFAYFSFRNDVNRRKDIVFFDSACCPYVALIHEA